MKKRIKSSKSDNRHTTKPYTPDMWGKYNDDYMIFNTKELARKYGVEVNTIYKWNAQLKKLAEIMPFNYNYRKR